MNEDLREGGNQVTVRVSSSLNNRLPARSYYRQIPHHRAAGWAGTDADH